MSVFVIIHSILCAFFYFVYIKFRPHVEFFKRRKIVYKPPVAIFGNLYQVVAGRKSFCDIIDETYRAFEGERVVGFFSFTQPQLVVRDPAIIEQITSTHFDHFVNRTDSFHDRILGQTLPALKNQHWRDMRSASSAIFTATSVKSTFELMTECTDDFVNYCESLHSDEEVDVKDLCEKFTINGIASCTFGFRADCLRKSEEIHEISTSLASNLRLFKRKILEILHRPLVNATTKRFLQKSIIDEIKLRQMKEISRPDVIQLLLHAKEGQLHHHEIRSIESTRLSFTETVECDVNPKHTKPPTWSDDDFIAQGLVFLTQGSGPISNLLTMLVYELAKNFDVQMQLMDEIDETNRVGISHDSLHAMKFLDCVVAEALRMWPPLAVTNRVCTENCELSTGDARKIAFSKGDQVIIPIHAIHHDERFYKNPNCFDPMRFAEENRGKIRDASFLPFGAGKRSCIASRFVLQQVKLFIHGLLSHFTVEMCSRTPSRVELKESFEFEVRERIFVRFRARKK